MQMAYVERRDGGFPSIRLQSLTRGDCARVSGPGLRTFRNIADVWGLSEKERIAALGEPARSTYHQWLRKAHVDEAVVLPFDTLLRISAVIGIYKALAILFEEPRQALDWLKAPHKGTVFQGASPLAFITDGAHDGIMTVRRYLDAWRGGEVGAGAAEGTFEPVREEDVVIL
jgi:hypothetical protein